MATTKAAIASAFGASEAPTPTPPGSNGTSAAAEAAPEQGGLPPVIEQPVEAPVELPAKPAFGRAPKPAPAPAGATSRLNRILPEAQRVLFYRREQNGQQAYIGDYDYNEIISAGGWQSFVKRHLKAYLDPGLNHIRVDVSDGKGGTVSHGEHPIYGDQQPVSAVPPPFPAAMPPPVDPLDMTERLQQQEYTRRKQIRDEWEAEEKRRKDALDEALKAAKGDGGGTAAMIAALAAAMRQPAPQPRDDGEYIDARIQRSLGPIAQTMNVMATRLEALAAAPAATPVLPPDPMKGALELVAALKPQQPVGPTAAEIAGMIRDALDRAKPKDEFSLKDYMVMKQGEEDRRERERDRIEAREREERRRIEDHQREERQRVEDAAKEDRRRLEAEIARVREESKEERGSKKDTLTSAVESFKMLKEAASLVGGDGGGGGVFSDVINLLSSEGLWNGLSDFVATVKTGGKDEEEETPENDGIDVTEKTTDAPESAAPAAASPPAAPRPAAPRPPKAAAPRKPAVVKPSDLATDDYPAGFDEIVAQLAGVSAKDSATPEESQAQIIATLAAAEFCRKNSPVWKHRIEFALTHIKVRGPKAVMSWLGPFLRGLARNGKLPLSNVENLERNLGLNAEAIVKWVTQRIAAATAAKAAAKAKAATPPAAPAAT